MLGRIFGLFSGGIFNKKSNGGAGSPPEPTQPTSQTTCGGCANGSCGGGAPGGSRYSFNCPGCSSNGCCC